MLKPENISLLKKNFEYWGLFISPKKTLPIKKKKKKKKIKYLKTDRYVIPIPSKEKEKKPKIHYQCIGLNFFLFYSDIDLKVCYSNRDIPILRKKWYYPNGATFLKKFSFLLKFDATRALKMIHRLLEEGSYPEINYSKKYFSSKNFKFFELVIFWDMFTKYVDPNKPLKKSWKPNPFPQIWGDALLRVKDIIFKELVFDHLGKVYEYTPLDYRNFELAEINPFDSKYYWPTWRLFILGLSLHNGWIYKNLETGHFSSLDKKEERSFYNFKENLENRILATIFTWFLTLKNINTYERVSKNYFWSISFFNFFKKNKSDWNTFICFCNKYSFSVNFFSKKTFQINEIPDDLNELTFESFFWYILLEFDLNSKKKIYTSQKNKLPKLEIFSSLQFESLFFKENEFLKNENFLYFNLPEVIFKIFKILLLSSLPFFAKWAQIISIFLKFLPSTEKLYKNLYFRTETKLNKFSTFLIYSHLSKTFNIPSAVFGYELFFKTLKTQLSKDENVKNFEPFGLNPFLRVLELNKDKKSTIDWNAVTPKFLFELDRFNYKESLESSKKLVPNIYLLYPPINVQKNTFFARLIGFFSLESKFDTKFKNFFKKINFWFKYRFKHSIKEDNSDIETFVFFDSTNSSNYNLGKVFEFNDLNSKQKKKFLDSQNHLKLVFRRKKSFRKNYKFIIFFAYKRLWLTRQIRGWLGSNSVIFSYNIANILSSNFNSFIFSSRKYFFKFIFLFYWIKYFFLNFKKKYKVKIIIPSDKKTYIN